LSVSPTPAFDTTKPMTLRQLYNVSPLGIVGMLLLGSVFSAQFGMAAVFAAEAGLSIGEISIFVAAFYVGATLLQYPLGWLSDRMDRRLLILVMSLIGSLGALLGYVAGQNFYTLIVAAVVIGGMSNPLYSLLMAYTNDFLEYEDMAAASGGLIFINGLGAIAGPIVTGWLMSAFGAYGFFLIIFVLMAALTVYAAYRMTQRKAMRSDDTTSYAPVLPTASVVAVEAAQEYVEALSHEDESAA
jgi:MFS family permease